MKTVIKSLSWKTELKEIFLIALIGIPWGFLMCRTCTDYTMAVLISSMIWVVLWKGNSYVGLFADLNFSWLEKPVQRLVFGVVAHVVFTFAAVYALYYLCLHILGLNIGDLNFILIISVSITLLLTTILYSRKFLLSWKELAIANERSKKEAMSARYETLKNQVDPHFLFNSFNTLTNLVYQSQDDAARYIKKLSQVYRYVLDVRDKEVVDLADEVEFVKAYVFLQKIRHQALVVEFELRDTEEYLIAPLSLQMLIENAIKHNVISSDEPLTIRVEMVNNKVIVVNNKQKKNTVVREDSAGVGLENIKARYLYLTKTVVEINDRNDRFEVKLPLIKKET